MPSECFSAQITWSSQCKRYKQLRSMSRLTDAAKQVIVHEEGGLHPDARDSDGRSDKYDTPLSALGFVARSGIPECREKHQPPVQPLAAVDMTDANMSWPAISRTDPFPNSFEARLSDLKLKKRVRQLINLNDEAKRLAKPVQDNSFEPVAVLTNLTDHIDAFQSATVSAWTFENMWRESSERKHARARKAKERLDRRRAVVVADADADKTKLEGIKKSVAANLNKIKAASERANLAEEALRKAQQEYAAAQDERNAIEVSLAKQKKEMNILESRVVALTVDLPQVMDHLSRKVKTTKRRLDVVNALKAYCVGAEKLLAEIMANTDSPVFQTIADLRSFMKEHAQKGTVFNKRAIEKALHLLRCVWNKPELPVEMTSLLECIPSGDAMETTRPRAPLSRVRNLDEGKTHVYYDPAVELHCVPDNHAEQVLRVKACLKVLRDDMSSAKYTLEAPCGYVITEVSPEYGVLPSTTILRLVHSGSYLMRIKSLSTRVPENESIRMEGSDDELVTYGIESDEEILEKAEVASQKKMKMLLKDSGWTGTAYSSDHSSSTSESESSSDSSGEVTSEDESLHEEETNRPRAVKTSSKCEFSEETESALLNVNLDTLKSLNLPQMIGFKLVRPGPFEIRYRGALIRSGLLLENGNFLVDGQEWDTPSGMALHYIRLEANTLLSTINGYVVVYFEGKSLGSIRNRFMKTIRARIENPQHAQHRRSTSPVELEEPLTDQVKLSLVNMNRDITIRDLIEHKALRPGPVTVLYHKTELTGGQLNAQGLFLYNGKTWDTPSGFALHLARKVNPELKTINGYTCVCVRGIKLEAARAKFTASVHQAKTNVEWKDQSSSAGVPSCTRASGNPSVTHVSKSTSDPNDMERKKDTSMPPSTASSSGLQYWLMLGGNLALKGSLVDVWMPDNHASSGDTFNWHRARVTRKIGQYEYSIQYLADPNKRRYVIDVMNDTWRSVQEEELVTSRTGRIRQVPQRFQDMPKLPQLGKPSVTPGYIQPAKKPSYISPGIKSSIPLVGSVPHDENSSYEDSSSEDDGEGPAPEDTFVSSGSHVACMHAAGVVCQAVDDVFRDGSSVRNAFCLVRPPGHHVGRYGRTSGCCSHGFCLLNNVAIGATRARIEWGCKKVAIIDFDVHFGNGTYEIFEEDDDTLFVSVHMVNDGQGNVFFGADLPGVEKITDSKVCIGLTGGASTGASPGRKAFARAFKEHVFPVLQSFDPEVLFLSAGFDGHKDDPLGGHLGLLQKDFREMTRQIVNIANIPGAACSGRIVSVLEGGYDVKKHGSLQKCVRAHVQSLAEKNPPIDRKWGAERAATSSALRPTLSTQGLKRKRDAPVSLGTPSPKPSAKKSKECDGDSSASKRYAYAII